jgi:hypothetical protein
MNTLLFKIGTLLFLGGSTFAAFLYSGHCPKGACPNSAACPYKARAVAAATMDQTAEPASMSEHCAKARAAAAASGCPHSAKKASGGCPFAHAAGSQVAQNTEQTQDLPAEAAANH